HKQVLPEPAAGSLEGVKNNVLNVNNSEREVKIKKLAPTLVRSPIFNEDSSISGYKETKRNNWQIENM
ncbi:hypothetical protein, partial [Proteus mirabilis]|uniref:hypothetical protein n=1 Tax=Proteus mirabilis TaxID=584 RepID=UPI0034E6A415